MISAAALGFPAVVSPLHRQSVSLCSGLPRQVVAGDGSCSARSGSRIAQKGSQTQIYSPLYVGSSFAGACSVLSREDEVSTSGRTENVSVRIKSSSRASSASASGNGQSKSNAGREVLPALNSNGAKSAAFVSRDQSLKVPSPDPEGDGNDGDGDGDLKPLLPSGEAGAQQGNENENENENGTIEEIVDAVAQQQSKATEEEVVSRVDPSLPTMRDIVATAAQEGINLQVKSFGPSFQIIVTSLDETVVFGKANGWIKCWWPKGRILHLESVILDRGLSKKVGNVFGAGFFVGAATLRYGLDQRCRTAELLAIYDDEATHSKLVKYYSRIGFKTLYEVNEEGFKYFLDRVVWGGVGTRMDADCEELLRRWHVVLKPKSKSRPRTKGAFSRRAPVVQ